eukprot:COSAG02_NODE_2106_length_9814_cov_3.447864_1_plen_98_part_00
MLSMEGADGNANLPDSAAQQVAEHVADAAEQDDIAIASAATAGVVDGSTSATAAANGEQQEEDTEEAEELQPRALIPAAQEVAVEDSEEEAEADGGM